MTTTRLHVTYTAGPLKDPTAPLGGESFWATENGDGTYTVDNVLFGSDLIGFRDRVRATYDGEWVEVTEVVESHPCYRGWVLFAHDTGARIFHRMVRDTFGDRVAMEGWSATKGAPAALQVEPGAWPDFQRLLESHPAVLEYYAEPTPTV